MEHLPKPKSEPNPYESANFFSKLFFLHNVDLWTKKYHQDLQQGDLYDVPSVLKSKRLGDQLEIVWSEQQPNPSIVHSIVKCYGLPYFLLQSTRILFKTTMIIVRPFLVAKFISCLSQTVTDGVSWYGLSLMVLLLVESWYDEWYLFRFGVLQLQIRSALSTSLYRKILKSSPFHNKDTSIGKILTLFTKDVHNFELLLRSVSEIWTSTLQAFVLLYLLFENAGFFTFILAAFYGILLPLQVNLAKKSTNLNKRMLEETDDRLQATNDLFPTLTHTKMVSWEIFTKSKVYGHRLNEVQLNCKVFFLKFLINLNGTLWACATFLPWLGIVLNHRNVPTETIPLLFLSYTSIFNILCVSLPQGICQLAQTLPTIKRLNSFFWAKESVRFHQPKTSRIRLSSVSVTIRRETVLSNINLKLDTGLVIITGAVGSGKTVLLKTILGDCECTRGSVYTEGRISYASQEAWLFPSTIKQNIVFGEGFDAKRYNRILEVCDLICDLQLFTNGDQTMVADRGINLSKGQRTKINLARALYKDSEIYLLDECLVDLDPVASNGIFESIRTFLQDRLVLLVTKDVKFVSRSRNCLVLNDNKTILSNNLETSGVEKLRNIWNPSQADAKGEIEDEETRLLSPERDPHTEDKKDGEVSRRIYEQWIRSGGGFSYFLLVSGFVLFMPTILVHFEKVLLLWARNEENIKRSVLANVTEPLLLHNRRNIVTGYIIMTSVWFILIMVTNLLFLHFVKNSSVRLHKHLIDGVIQSSQYFLNRCSTDLLNIDEVVPFLLYDLYKLVFPIVAVTVAVITVRKVFTILLIILILIGMYFREIYVKLGRPLKRMQASARSPCIGYFTATLDGLSVIKSRGVEHVLRDDFDTKLDVYTSASFMYLSSKRFFSFVLRCSFIVSVGIVIGLFLVFNLETTNSVLTIFQSIFLSQSLQVALLTWAEIETNMTSVERVLHQEQPQKPSKGTCLTEATIKFENVNLYSDLHESLLKNITFTVGPKEKIGIVGRTGVGKTSLIDTLLKLRPFEGRIHINGTDLELLSSQFLRSNISVISQNVYIANATIRQNLDPDAKFTDAEIRQVLEKLNLKRFIYDLDLAVRDKDSVFSPGQKQLIALARIVLKNNHIAIMDNPTANVDRETEGLMCDIIEQKICCTMVVISHSKRLLSSCDRIFVLESSSIREVDKDAFLGHKGTTFFENG